MDSFEGAFRWLQKTASPHLNAEDDEIVEALLAQRDVVLSFLAPHGKQHLLLFCYYGDKDAKVLENEETMSRAASIADSRASGTSAVSRASTYAEDEEKRSNPSTTSSKAKSHGVVVSTAVLNLTFYKGCSFRRVDTRACLTGDNIAKTVVVTPLGGRNGSERKLGARTLRLLNSAVLPSLTKRSRCKEDAAVNYGLVLAKSLSTGLHVVDGVVDTLVDLPRPTRSYKLESSSKALAKAASKPEVVRVLDAAVKKWCDVVDEVLAGTEGLSACKDDADTVAVELSAWRRLKCNISYIEEQADSRPNLNILAVLDISGKSAGFRRWKRTRAVLLQAISSVEQTAQHLAALQSVCDVFDAPNSTPSQLATSLSSLMRGLRQFVLATHGTSDANHPVPTFPKVSNMLLDVMKRYLDSPCCILSQQIPDAISKVQETAEFGHKYLTMLHDFVGEVQLEGVSLSLDHDAVFGRVELFHMRLVKLSEVLLMAQQFERLRFSTVSAFGSLVDRFRVLFQMFARRNPDCLDARKNQFDVSFIDFKGRVADISTDLVAIVNSCFLNVPNSVAAIALLVDLKRMLAGSPRIQQLLDEKEISLFMSYGREVETIRAIFEDHADNPVLERNAPPIAGRISWSRQLLKRIEEPMQYFSTKEELMKRRESKPLIRQYNTLASTIIQYESRWHAAWMAHVTKIAGGVNSTLLICDRSTNQIYVNFDTHLHELVSEARWMRRLGLEVPKKAREIQVHRPKFLVICSRLDGLVKSYYSLLRTVEPSLAQLFVPHIQKVNNLFNQGIVQITWTSTALDRYIGSVHSKLYAAAELVWRVNTTYSSRYQQSLRDLATQPWVEFGEDEPSGTAELLRRHAAHVRKVSRVANIKSLTVVQALRSIILESGTSDDQLVSTMTANAQREVTEAVMEAVKHSVRLIKTRFSSAAAAQDDTSVPLLFASPIVVVEAQLSGHSIKLTPDMAEVTRAVNTMARLILEGTKNVLTWEQDQPRQPAVDVADALQALVAGGAQPSVDQATKSDAAEADEDFDVVLPGCGTLRSIHGAVASNRKVGATMLQLAGILDPLKEELAHYYKGFEPFEFLYKSNRADVVDAFLHQSPSIPEFEQQLAAIDAVARQARDIEEGYDLGCVRIDVKLVKEEIGRAAAEWKAAYGVHLVKELNRRTQRLLQQVGDFSLRLSRPLHDLQDVHLVSTTITELRSVETDMEAQIQPLAVAYETLRQQNVAFERYSATEALDQLVNKKKQLLDRAVVADTELRSASLEYQRAAIQARQQLDVGVAELAAAYASDGPNIPGLTPRDAVQRVKKFSKMYNDLNKKFQVYKLGEELFALQKQEYSELARIGKELAHLSRLYDVYTEVLVKLGRIEETFWADMNPGNVEHIVTRCVEDCSKLPIELKALPAYKELKRLLDRITMALPIFSKLKHKSTKRRHWEALSSLCGETLDPSNTQLRVRSLMVDAVLTNAGAVDDLLSGASKEADVELKLAKIAQTWAAKEVVLAPWKGRGSIVLHTKHTRQLLQELEDAQLVATSLLASRYNAAFKKDILAWAGRLSAIHERMEEWLEVQHAWADLEGVFVSADIAKEMPGEVRRFHNLDRQWVKIMKAASENPNVMKLCASGEMLANLLPHLNQYLKASQRSLVGYIYDKRVTFPRFFFVSDLQLLDILGQSSDAFAIIPHLPSLTSNVKDLRFDDDMFVVGWESAEGEVVEAVRPVLTEGRDVIEWLDELLVVARHTLHAITSHAYDDIRLKFDDGHGQMVELRKLVETYPCQVALLGLQLLWTADCEAMLHNIKTERNMGNTKLRRCRAILEWLVSTMRETSAPTDKMKLEVLVTIQIHLFDVLQGLVKNSKKLTGPSDFEWTSQLRFNWRSEYDSVVVGITEVDILYGFEYVGCVERLVVTPLTDRIYISCAQAIGMHFGGAPCGPAGTGKTETTRDLGRACGRYHLVINCSELMTNDAMGKLIKGTAVCGCWIGFDEINRVSVSVLSVVATQVASVFHAKRDNKKEFVFADGSTVSLNKECGIFITMNPTYAGRSELPENMKSLFRVIAVVVPDVQAIIRVRLAAAGFQDNLALSRKMGILYSLCGTVLSERTYDFGLRNILSVMRLAAQSMLRVDATQVDETALLLQAINSVNLSKLVDKDADLFSELIADVFGGSRDRLSQNKPLTERIERFASTLGLVAVPSWVTRISQTYEQWCVRHGLCLYGPPASGKSSILAALSDALVGLHGSHRTYRISPKALLAAELFGTFDPKTDDWTDGVLVSLWRKAARAPQQLALITFDGPIDPVWVENLNSVLDDGRILTLANGDRLPLPSHLKLAFEVDSLAHASPATISRLGTTYVSARTVGWEATVSSWGTRMARKSRHKSTVTLVVDALTEGIKLAQNFVANNSNHDPIVGITNCLSVAYMMLQNMSEYVARRSAVQVASFSLLYGFDPVLRPNTRSGFVQILAPALSKGTLLFPDDPYSYHVTEAGAWVKWSAAEIAVPHHDVVVANSCWSSMFFMSRANGMHVLLVGDVGTGKSTLIKPGVLGFAADEKDVKSCSVTRAADPISIRRLVLSCVERVSGSAFRPLSGKSLTLVLDDLHLADRNVYDQQVVGEFVRQLVEDGGFHNFERMAIEWVSPTNTSVLATTVPFQNQPKAPIPERLYRHFLLVRQRQPSLTDVKKIAVELAAQHVAPLITAFDAQPVLVQHMELFCAAWDEARGRIRADPQAPFYHWFGIGDVSQLVRTVALASDLQTPDDLRHLMHSVSIQLLSKRLKTDSERAWVATLVDKRCSVHQTEQWMCPFFRPDHEEERRFAPFSDEAMCEGTAAWASALTERQLKGLPQVCWPAYFTKSLHTLTAIVSAPGGHALLLGSPGCGKQTLVKLACLALNYTLVPLKITQTTTRTTFHEQLKASMRHAAQNHKVCFLVSDVERPTDYLLEVVSMFVDGRELPSVFARDELEIALDEVKTAYEHAGGYATNGTLMQYYQRRVFSNVHVAFALATSSETETLCAQFPSVLHGCVPLFLGSWPQLALREAAQHFLTTRLPWMDGPQVQRLGMVASDIHVSVESLHHEVAEKQRRHLYCSAKDFFDLLARFASLLDEKRDATAGKRNAVVSGLQCMSEAHQAIIAMRLELKEKQVELKETARHLCLLMDEIARLTHEAELATAEVERERNAMQVQMDQISAEKESADRDMQAAEPALLAAAEALRNIKTEDIVALKALPNPPITVRRIMDAVLILKHQPMDGVAVEVDSKGVRQMKPSWATAKVMMNDMQFLPSLMNYNKDSVTAEQIELLQPYLQRDDFTAERAKIACGSLAGLCTWCRTQELFFTLSRAIEPKRQRVREAEVAVYHAKKELAAAQAKVDEQREKLDQLNQRYKGAVDDQTTLKETALAIERKVATAEELTAGLQGECRRWEMEKRTLAAVVDRLPGDVLATAVFVTYGGPLDISFRSQLHAQTMLKLSTAVPTTDGLDPKDLLCDEQQARDWKLVGLPADELSLQNAVLLAAHRGGKFPLLLDPQCQGQHWISSNATGGPPVATTTGSTSFVSSLETALTDGRLLLIEDAESSIDALQAMRELLTGSFTKILEADRTESLVVTVGKREFTVHPNFQLCLVTRRAAALFPPDFYSNLNVVEYGVTQVGLENQLLGTVLESERPSLERERHVVQEDIRECTASLMECETLLLGKLQTEGSRLLDDPEPVRALREVQQTAVRIEEKLERVKQAEEKIEASREEFRPVARRGSALFFALAQMRHVNNLYEASLQDFQRLFDRALVTAPPNPFPPKRIASLISTTTQMLYERTVCGFYANDAAVYQLITALFIELSDGSVSAKEMQILLTGPSGTNDAAATDEDDGENDDNLRQRLVPLHAIPAMKQLSVIVATEPKWEQWRRTKKPESQPFPTHEEELSPMQRLLLVRFVRPDRILPACVKYVKAVLGPMAHRQRNPAFVDVAADVTAIQPVLCLLSVGADPSVAIEVAARRLKANLVTVSMGEGQEVFARSALSNALNSGDWVALQNVHLSHHYCLELSDQLRVLRSQDTKSYNSGCRIWLTTEQSPTFPSSLLQACFRVSEEPARGVRSGLVRAYRSLTQDQLDAIPTKEWRQMLYAISFFHSIMSERKKFGTLGWAGAYDFTGHDLQAASMFLYNHLYTEARRGVVWMGVQYMIGEVYYGGRVVDVIDRRTLTAYCQRWFSEGLFGRNFEFSRGYSCPDFRTVADYQDYVEGLPTNETAEVFGLHPHADLLLTANASTTLLEKVVTALHGATTQSGALVDPTAAAVEACTHLRSVVSPNVKGSDLVRFNKKKGPIAAFITKEVSQLQSLVAFVHSAVDAILAAVKQSTALSAQQLADVDSLALRRVPLSWGDHRLDRDSLPSWTDHIVDSSAQFGRIVARSVPRVVWLGGFFNPGGFLASIKMEYRRSPQCKGSLDEVGLTLEASKITHAEAEHMHFSNEPSEVVFLAGVQLEGAGWDSGRHCLTDAVGPSLVSQLTIIRVTPKCVSSGSEPQPGAKTYHCPVYKSARRGPTDKICDVVLRAEEGPLKWQLRGVAGICSNTSPLGSH